MLQVYEYSLQKPYSSFGGAGEVVVVVVVVVVVAGLSFCTRAILAHMHATEYPDESRIVASIL